MAHYKAESVPKGMEKQFLDHSPIEKALINIASLESLVKGYILNCRCEGKSQATVDTYEQILTRFLWFSQANGYPDEPLKISPSHMRGFLWYLASESNR